MPRSLGFSSWALCTLLAGATCAGADLKITTLTSFNGKHATRHTVYFKDNRQRTEFQPEDPTTPWFDTATLYQCDQNRLLQISPRYRTYDYSALDQNGYLTAKPQPIPAPQAGNEKGGDVTITIGSVDTGERKPMGSYIARRVKTSIRVESGAGACMSDSLTETDGWYVDLPFDLACRKQPKRAGFSYLAPGGCRDRLSIKRAGEAELGYPIEATTIRTEAGQTTTTTTELLQFSEAPLDQALFELPEGYSPAMRTAHGADFTRPNTLKNRVGNYWAVLRSAVARLWP